jgi:hypothetical protein
MHSMAAALPWAAVPEPAAAPPAPPPEHVAGAGVPLDTLNLAVGQRIQVLWALTDADASEDEDLEEADLEVECQHRHRLPCGPTATDVRGQLDVNRPGGLWWWCIAFTLVPCLIVQWWPALVASVDGNDVQLTCACNSCWQPAPCLSE